MFVVGVWVVGEDVASVFEEEVVAVSFVVPFLAVLQRTVPGSGESSTWVSFA